MKSKCILVLIVTVLFSCGSEHVKNTTTFTYLLYIGRDETIKLMSYNDYRWHLKNDSLLQKVNFQYKNKKHEIRLFTSISDTDGANISYELDSIGIVYSRSLGYKNFMQLTCNTDSINELITITLGHIILETDLRCIGCNNSKYIKPLKYVLPDNVRE